MKKLFIISFFLHLASIVISQGNYEEFISGNWQLRRIGDEKWIDSVSFPNSIHRILLDKKIIENPYNCDNEKNLRWIEESDWEAETEFKAFICNNMINEIKFESLEPFTKVYINDKFLFESKNAFLNYQYDINKYLSKKSNINKLRLVFESPVKRAKELQSKNTVFLPYDERVYIRKPQYEFGWDWGPRFVKSGVKSWISLKVYNHNTRINNEYITISELNADFALINYKIEIFSDITKSEHLSICEGEKIYYSKKIKLKEGINKINCQFKIRNPKMWWPNGMGEQKIYYLNTYLHLKQSPFDEIYVLEKKEENLAICKIKLMQEKDSIGESFYFNINGKSTYLKGFNLIPESHISEFDNINDNYSKLITSLKSMNCNAVRIWGGGEYLSDQVMEELQTYGIIVWQDFMFAGGMYPGDSSFLNNVEEEITYQVKRLRNYNNIALYCGNNEIDEAWHNWGWQKQYNYSKEDSTKIWNDYVKLFHELIPSIVRKYDPDTDYIPSSPEIGWGRKESMTQGDSHYWGVWWGKEPIETFEEKIPRFMSEFGMQAMPDLSTLRKVIPDSLMNFNSPEFKNHQKHPTGFETLNYYLEKYLTVPDNLEDYAYATQLLQAITLQKAIAAQRLSEKCMGTLIWQLNDTWPVTSWSVLDSEGKKKLSSDYVKRGFENQFVGKKNSKNEYLFYANFNPEFYLHCLPENNNCWYEMSTGPYFQLEIRDFYGKIYLDTLISTNFKPNEPKLFLTVKKESLKNFKENNSYCRYRFNLQEEPKYSNSKIDYFVPLKELEIEKPKLDFISKTVEKKVWKHSHTSETENIQFYEINCKAINDVHFLQFNDTLNSENHFYRYVEGPLRGEPNKVPTELIAGEEFKLLFRKSDFPNEQAAIDYVKKNLKSINHLLGK